MLTHRPQYNSVEPKMASASWCFLNIVSSSVCFQIALKSDYTSGYHNKVLLTVGQSCYNSVPWKVIPAVCMPFHDGQSLETCVRFSKHLQTLCGYRFCLFYYEGESWAVTHMQEQSKEVGAQFVNNIFSSGIWFIQGRHRCHLLFFRYGNIVCYLKASYTKSNGKHGRSHMGHGTDLISQPWATLRDLKHYAFLMLLYPSIWLMECCHYHERWLDVQSCQHHFKKFKVLQTNLFLQITLLHAEVCSFHILWKVSPETHFPAVYNQVQYSYFSYASSASGNGTCINSS